MWPRRWPPTSNAGKNPLLAQRPEQRILLVLVTSDKGLAGAFNTNLIKAAQRVYGGARRRLHAAWS